jgi:hypothetical protein
MDPITSELVVSSAQIIINKIAGETFDFISSKYKLLHLGSSKDKYLEYCQKTLHVKTLFSPDKAVFIDDIYVPLTLKGINTGSVTVSDATILDLPQSAILIKGLAGQGKSTILRKLLANNLRTKKSFAIFYELKNYKGGDIEDALESNFKISGVDIDKISIEKILSESTTRLYLDAFDEINPKYRLEFLDQFQKIYNKYICKIVCTSRPDTEIDSLSDFCTYYVDKLNQKQIFDIIHRSSTDKEKAIELCAALKRSPLHNDSESILKSPILVVLYCISYNLGEDIPSTLSQFYCNIFDTIFYRHDNIKGRVNRIRHWNDNRQIYRELFNCLCFLSQRTGANSFDRYALTTLLGKSLEYLNEDNKLSDKIFDELSFITNLIIEDGYNEYRFVHKSIQEFFTSSFIKSLPYDKKCDFYNRCAHDSKFYSLFSNTLFFLREMDYYDYCEKYLIPSVSNLLNLDNKALCNEYDPSDDLVDKFINNMIIKVKYSKIYDKQIKQNLETFESSAPTLNNAEKYSEAHIRLFNSTVQIMEIFSIDEEMERFIVTNGIQSDDCYYSLPLIDIFKKKGISRDEVKDKLRIAVYVVFHDEYNQAIEKVHNRNKVLMLESNFDF